MKDNGKNIVPRSYVKIVAIEKTTGEKLHIYRNIYGNLALSETTGKYFYIGSERLRDKRFYEFLEVIRTA